MERFLYIRGRVESILYLDQGKIHHHNQADKHGKEDPSGEKAVKEGESLCGHGHAVSIIAYLHEQL